MVLFFVAENTIKFKLSVYLPVVFVYSTSEAMTGEVDVQIFRQLGPQCLKYLIFPNNIPVRFG